MTRRPAGGVTAAVVAVVAALVLSGCGFHGTTSLPAPFAKGGGASASTITIDMADVANLVPHAEVKVDDVTVGTVSAIAVDDWHAVVTVKLEKGVHLPANAIAMIGQKSLLGAEYLDLAAPATGATGTLTNGATIPISATSRYPETEEVLAALSTVLNDSGLAQVHTIATELNASLDGNQGDARALLTNLDTLVGGLDQQKTDITTALTSLDSLGAVLAQGDQTLATGIDQIGPGLAVLERNRIDLTNTLTALGKFGTVADQVVTATQQDLVGTLHDLTPTLAALGDAQGNLVGAIGELATFPFPLDEASRLFRGDYVNLFAALDVRCTSLTTSFLAGVPELSSLLPQLCSSQATTTLDPLMAPLTQAPSKKAAGTPSTPTAPTTPASGLLGGLSTVLGGLLPSKESTPTPRTSPTATPTSSSTATPTGGLLGGLLGGGS